MKIKGSINEMIRPDVQAPGDKAYYEGLERYYQTSPATNLEKLQAFTKHVPLSDMNKLLARFLIFQHVLPVHGDIIECGVYRGAGLMSWAQFSAIMEPLNHHRRIRGFDTFKGFAGIHQKDSGNLLEIAKKGGLTTNAYQDVLKRPFTYMICIACWARSQGLFAPGRRLENDPGIFKEKWTSGRGAALPGFRCV